MAFNPNHRLAYFDTADGNRFPTQPRARIENLTDVLLSDAAVADTVVVGVDSTDPRLPDAVIDAGVSKTLLDVLDPSGARYAIRQTTGTFESGTYSDTTFNIGYNVSATPGVKAVAGQPMLFLQWESKFRQSPTDPYLAEFHLNFNGTNAGLPSLIRPIGLTIEHDTHICDLAFVADVFTIFDHNANQLMNFGAGAWYLRKPTVISAGTTAASSITVGEAGFDAKVIMNCATAKANSINWFRNTVASWTIYDAAAANLIIRDEVNARAQVTVIPGATAATANTDFASNIRATGNQGEFGAAAAKAVIGSLGTADAWIDAQGSNANITLNLRSKGSNNIISLKPHQFSSTVGFNGSAPVAKSTGWGAPTGTATKTTFATSTVTLPELAERVKALIDYFTLRGDIGA